MLSKARVSQKRLLRPVDFTSILMVYRSKNGSWRGFVHPYDISFEGESKKNVVEALKEMVETYEDMLREANHPEHLANKILSNEEDHQIFNRIALDTLAKRKKVDTPAFYAETIFPR